MMKICVLGSGSRGNSIWVKSSHGDAVLFDAGISLRAIENSLEELNESLDDIKAVIISHEHTDHTRSLAMVHKKLGCPLFASAGTSRMLQLPDGRLHFKTFKNGCPFEVGSMKISSFPVPHDAEDPVGFIVKENSTTLGLCTDLGYVTDIVKESLAGVNAMVLESNHDHNMLMGGPYPSWLKQRIRGKRGHLANHDSAALLYDTNHPELEHVFLAHMSVKNNTPALARESAASALSLKRTSLHLTWQNRASQLVEF